MAKSTILMPMVQESFGPRGTRSAPPSDEAHRIAGAAVTRREMSKALNLLVKLCILTGSQGAADDLGENGFGEGESLGLECQTGRLHVRPQLRCFMQQHLLGLLLGLADDRPLLAVERLLEAAPEGQDLLVLGLQPLFVTTCFRCLIILHGSRFLLQPPESRLAALLESCQRAEEKEVEADHDHQEDENLDQKTAVEFQHLFVPSFVPFLW